MHVNWAEENLQVIRTLMERAALYRRALAPMSLWAGSVGCLTGALGWAFKVESGKPFLLLWSSVGLLALAGCFFIVRRQAMRDGDPLWSAPTRKVARALAPALAAGTVFALIVLRLEAHARAGTEFIVPLLWMLLFGLGLHAAGFFLPGKMQLLGWAFVSLPLLVFGALAMGILPELPTYSGHLLMAGSFGGFHLIAGIYLLATETRRPTP